MGKRGRRGGDRSVPPRRARRPRATAPAGARRPRALGGRLRQRSRDHVRRSGALRSHGRDGRAPERPPARGACPGAGGGGIVVVARTGSAVGGEDATPDARGRPRARLRRSPGPDREEDDGDVRAWSRTRRCEAVLAGPISRTAEKALGLRELAELDAGEAYGAIVRRTVRYAAYQRKWMRRIPDIVLVDGDRPPEEVAGGILDLARAR